MLKSRHAESLKRARLRRRLVSLSALASTLFPSIAKADWGDQRWLPGVGIFAAYAFGSAKGVEWGAETFATYRLGDSGLGCSWLPRTGVGGLMQFALINTERPRLTLAFQGGGEFERTFGALTGELGATARFGQHAGFGIHTGLTLESVILNAFARHQWILDSSAIGGGVRIWPTYGEPGFCVAGRPLRTENGAICAATRQRPSTPAQSGGTNEVLHVAARGWEQDAHYECASVPAFLQLAAELLHHGAPDALVERALDSAQDEIRHTALCARLASRYAGERIWPALPDTSLRPALAGTAGLLRLAQESWIDGCLAEGAAAERAARAATLAHDPQAKAAQTSIARDERRHAELGWSILKWAAQRGGDDVRDAIRSLRTADPQANEFEGASVAGNANESVTAEKGAVAHGRLDAREMHRVTEQHVTASRRRLDRAL